MFKILLTNFLILSVLSGGRAHADTVDAVDLNLYVGEWHEIRRIPNEFQDNILDDGFGVCEATKAAYGFLPNGKISVTNTCVRFSEEGESFTETAEGIARVVRNSNNAKLKVNFTGVAFLRWLGIGDGDYWIFGLGPVNEDGLYSWALVGAPGFDYGWVLSRDAQMSSLELDEILALAEEVGFDITQFVDRM